MFIGTRFTLNYCLETFSQTEPEFTVELGNRVLKEWGKATPEDKILFNLAATVECAPSNHYADMVRLSPRSEAIKLTLLRLNISALTSTNVKVSP